MCIFFNFPKESFKKIYLTRIYGFSQSTQYKLERWKMFNMEVPDIGFILYKNNRERIVQSI